VNTCETESGLLIGRDNGVAGPRRQGGAEAEPGEEQRGEKGHCERGGEDGIGRTAGTEAMLLAYSIPILSCLFTVSRTAPLRPLVTYS